MILANALRGAGVIVAVLGLLDPAARLPWSDKRRGDERQLTGARLDALRSRGGTR